MSVRELVGKYTGVMFGLMLVSCTIGAALFGSSIGMFLAAMIGAGFQNGIVLATLWLYPFEIPPSATDRGTLIGIAIITGLAASAMYGLV